MEGAPERVFDLLYMCQAGNEKVLGPTLTVLNCISADRFSSDFQMNHFGSGPGHIAGPKNNRKVCVFWNILYVEYIIWRLGKPIH